MSNPAGEAKHDALGMDALVILHSRLCTHSRRSSDPPLVAECRGSNGLMQVVVDLFARELIVIYLMFLAYFAEIHLQVSDHFCSLLQW